MEDFLLDKSDVLNSLAKAFAQHRKKNGSYCYGSDLKRQTLDAFEYGLSFGEIREAASISHSCLAKWKGGIVKPTIPKLTHSIQIMDVKDEPQQMLSLAPPVLVLRLKGMSVEVYQPK